MIVKKDITVTFDKYETDTLSKIMELMRVYTSQLLPSSALGLTENEHHRVKHLIDEFFRQVY